MHEGHYQIVLRVHRKDTAPKVFDLPVINENREKFNTIPGSQ